MAEETKAEKRTCSQGYLGCPHGWWWHTFVRHDPCVTEPWQEPIFCPDCDPDRKGHACIEDNHTYYI